MGKAREMTWNDIKAELAQVDRAGPLGLLKDLHALRPENRAFLAARFGVGSDPLAPFQKEIQPAERNTMLKRLDAVGGSLRNVGWGAPPLGFAIFLGDDYAQMAKNQVRNLAERRIRTVTYIARS